MMKNKTIYLIRHSETDYNINKIIQGRLIDSDININGIIQSLALFKKLQNIKFNKIYLTTLKRTYQTMLPFIECGVPYKKIADFDELSFGRTEGKPIFDESGKSILFDYFDEWNKGNFDFKIDGGESPNEALCRIKNGFDEIMKYDNEKIIAICLHQRILRIVLCFLLDKSLTEMDNFPHNNSAYSILHYNNKNKKFLLLDYNNIMHLKKYNL